MHSVNTFSTPISIKAPNVHTFITFPEQLVPILRFAKDINSLLKIGPEKSTNCVMYIVECSLCIQMTSNLSLYETLPVNDDYI